jgi:hypothetical protein
MLLSSRTQQTQLPHMPADRFFKSSGQVDLHAEPTTADEQTDGATTKSVCSAGCNTAGKTPACDSSNERHLRVGLVAPLPAVLPPGVPLDLASGVFPVMVLPWPLPYVQQQSRKHLNTGITRSPCDPLLSMLVESMFCVFAHCLGRVRKHWSRRQIERHQRFPRRRHRQRWFGRGGARQVAGVGSIGIMWGARSMTEVDDLVGVGSASCGEEQG